MAARSPSGLRRTVGDGPSAARQDLHRRTRVLIVATAANRRQARSRGLRRLSWVYLLSRLGVYCSFQNPDTPCLLFTQSPPKLAGNVLFSCKCRKIAVI